MSKRTIHSILNHAQNLQIKNSRFANLSIEEKMQYLLEGIRQQTLMEECDKKMKTPKGFPYFDALSSTPKSIVIAFFRTHTSFYEVSPQGMIVDFHYEGRWLGNKKCLFTDANWFCPLQVSLLTQDIAHHTSKFLDRLIWKKLFLVLSPHEFMKLIQRFGFCLVNFRVHRFSVLYQFMI